MVDSTTRMNNHVGNGESSSGSKAWSSNGLPGRLLNGAALFLEVVWLHIRIWAEVFYNIYLTIVQSPEKSVAGEVVLVTGAGHGIGREIALRFASLGSVVVCVDINEKGAADTAKEIKSLGATKAVSYKCDVSNREEVLAMAKQVAQEVGPVTVLMNNAGIMPTKPFLEHNPEELRKIFDVNIMAHFWMLQAFLPSMIERKHGHVVATSSMCGQMGMTNLAPYCSSKFAVRGLMESLAVEQYDTRPDLVDKVRFTTIYPYMVNTGLVKSHTVRFESLMPMLNPRRVAEEIVAAMRRNELEASVPRWMFHFNRVIRLYPSAVHNLLRDFLQVKIMGD